MMGTFEVGVKKGVRRNTSSPKSQGREAGGAAEVRREGKIHEGSAEDGE